MIAFNGVRSSWLMLEKSRFVLARHFELPVEIAELLRGAVDVGRQRTQFVAIADGHTLGEVTGSDLIEPRVDLADRPDQRPRDRAAEDQGEGDGADHEGDDDR